MKQARSAKLVNFIRIVSYGKVGEFSKSDLKDSKYVEHLAREIKTRNGVNSIAG